MSEVEKTPVQPELILAHGRVAEINIPAAAAVEIDRFDRSDPNSPITFRVEGDRGFWIRIFDGRRATIAAYAQYLNDKDMGALDATFATCPALVRFAIKHGTQYVVLMDLGVEDMFDSGDEHPLVLTRGGHFNKDAFRVVVTNGKPALHLATKICLVEARPPKPEKVEAETASVEAEPPVNPAMAEAFAGITLAE